MEELDENQIDDLVRAHKDAVYRQLFRICGNHDDAEDVLAESLLKAFEAITQLEQRENFRAWLVQIGRRTCGRLRKRQALLPYVNWSLGDLEISEDPSAGPDQLAVEVELKDCIEVALNGLPKHFQEVYRLRDIEGLSATEVSKQLSISVANVKSRLHRARKLVREEIDASLLINP